MPRAKTTSPTFRRMLRDIQDGEIVVPVLRAYLFSPEFPGFSVKVPPSAVQMRGGDGWFHPSTHPLWGDRQLFYYLTEPERFISEPFDPTGAMAVTQGHFWHGFIAHCLLDAKVIKAAEVEVSDPDTGSRGAMDGVADWGVFEFKTINERKLKRIETLEDYKKIMPHYYAQGQEYMRMSGLKEHRTVFLVPSYPFELKEIAMPYDMYFAEETRSKYVRVRQAVADQRMPQPCCGPGSKQAKACPARGVCPVGMMT